ncbi:hypothetical protein ACE198_23720 [Neobacillus sp. KR4-4]|uniref:hypothetical protein n=1 Tax=Neobacillus sp. KR4-4 TaxID=3344872 RepID=UPI0035CA2F8A
MIWMKMVKELKPKNEEKFVELLKRTPCDPLIYVLKVEQMVGVNANDYYKILMKKYEEESNDKLFKVAREYEYLLRNDRDGKKDW